MYVCMYAWGREARAWSLISTDNGMGVSVDTIIINNCWLCRKLLLSSH